MKLAHLSALRFALVKAVEAAGFEVNPDDIHLETPGDLAHGHFASNVAMLLARQKSKNPREVAAAILKHLKSDIIEKTEVAGPGFINLWLTQTFYTSELASLIQNFDTYLEGAIALEKKKTLVIEYSSPNIAKPMGAHHLLTTIIGDGLKRIFKTYGYKVFAENYPGDLGTQFGKLMVAIRLWSSESKIEQNPIEEMLALYVKFHEEAEKDPALEDAARAEYKKFEDGDKEARRLWKKIVDWSFKEIQPLYDRLGVTYDGVHGESFFEERMKTILEEGRAKGVFVDGEKGSWIVLPDNPEDPPALVKKSDGASLYLTRDLAQMDFLGKEYHPDTIAWVVDVAQSLYFQQRFHAYRKLRQTHTEFVHVVFGRMDFKGGSMSTRKGNIIRLLDLLNEAEEQAMKLVQEKTEGMSPDETKELARILGIGSVKYNILSQNRIQNITFDWDRMLSFEGNSAPYLMYTAARANSILRKSEIKPTEFKKYTLHLAEPAEFKVAIHLLRYPFAIERAALEYKPNHLATALYELAQDFNSLYNAFPVLKAPEELKESRLLLTAAVSQTLTHGLSLLGIEVPKKM